VVIGPSLAGILVALAGPGTVIALDAGSYAVSVLAPGRSLRLPGRRDTRRAPPYLEDLREGWAEFPPAVLAGDHDGPSSPCSTC